VPNHYESLNEFVSSRFHERYSTFRVMNLYSSECSAVVPLCRYAALP